MSLEKIPSGNDVNVLLSFLNDTNEQTVALAKQQLKQILRQHPSFRNLLEKPGDPALEREAQAFLEESCLEELKEKFRTLSTMGDALDLELGAIYLAQSAYRDLEAGSVSRHLDRLAEGIEESIDAQDGSSAREVAVLRRYVFEGLGFLGNERNYYDPDNSYIHQVLERRIGLPISLSCVYLLIARRLDLPVHGVGLPGHFIVAHDVKPGAIYIDPYHRGRVLTRHDCIEIVRRRGLGFQEAFLAPTPPRQILARMIVNLVNLYTERGAVARAQWLTQILGLLEDA